MKRLVLLLLLALPLAGCADRSPTQAPRGPALDLAGGPEFSEWSQAALVPAPIRDEANWEGCPFVSKDGLDLYFRKIVYSAEYNYQGWDIFVSHRAAPELPWGPPTNLGPNVNTGFADEMCSFVSVDGHWLYFVSTRADIGQGGMDLFVSHRKDKDDPTGWEEPKNLGPNVNTGWAENGPSIFEDEATGAGVLYYAQYRPGRGNVIVSSPMIDKETCGPASVVPELSSGMDLHPFIRGKDGLEIVFASSRPVAGRLGGADLYAATRATTQDPWSPPVNLGAAVNSKYNEARPSLSWDGRELYFWTDREQALGAGYRVDVYRATRTKLHGK